MLGVILDCSNRSLVSVLKEIKQVRQIKGEHRRRWFTDESMDLTVWLEEPDTIVRFQLCYGKPNNEHALTWRKNSGFTHNRVDEGYNPGKYKATPILLSDGKVEWNKILNEFLDNAGETDKKIINFVSAKLSHGD